jgi:hypothetical protein
VDTCDCAPICYVHFNAQAVFHIAQLNIAKMRTSLEDPSMVDFVDALAPVNALADQAPGFVWRLQTEDGNATAVTMYDDPALIVNMSVWQSIDDLMRFVQSDGHIAIMKRRREWFVRMAEASLVLWWIPIGHIPTIAEAQDRLDSLRISGPGPRAFSFRQLFESPR